MKNEPQTSATVSRSPFHTRQLALVGLMSAVLCILGPWALNIGISPVPISLGTLGIYFVVFVLGTRQGTVSVLIYLLLGAAGLPVFTNFSGGIGKLLGPTGGYLIGYIFMVLLCGFFVDKWFPNIPVCVIGMVLGTLVCYFFGTVWLAWQGNMSLTAALAAAVLPYLPGDTIKLALAVTVGYQVRKRLTKAGLLSGTMPDSNINSI